MTSWDVGGKESQMTQGFWSEWEKDATVERLGQIAMEAVFGEKLLSAVFDLKMLSKTSLEPFVYRILEREVNLH